MVKGLVFIGSRANYGRLYMVLKEMIKNKDWLEFKIFLASSGTYIDIEEFTGYVGYRVDGLMYKDTPSNMAFTTATVMQHASNYLKEHYFDFCMIHGDRYECLGMAAACLFNGLPIIHNEGGETSGSYDNTIRYLISHMAEYHFVTSEDARHRLNFSIDSINIINVGSPTIDMVYNVLERRMPESPTQFAVVLYNPLVGEDYMPLLKAVRHLAGIIKIVWVNPNVDPGFKNLVYNIKARNKIEFIKDLTPAEYIKLLDRAMLLIGNTSSGIKEGAAIGIPYILVGNRQQERQISNNTTLCRMDTEEICRQAKRFLGAEQVKITYSGTFGNGLASEKMLTILKEVYNK